ncbi:carbohydrate kinase family protein [Cryobacterium adonitolivorans]|uniref:Carbohydrate kinase family protein n=1 Tax=Cryobacterium adonitolivorans TaxID=1259189 RepID=A0A4R8W926_9MICO|nr:carbohydrate kinase family protein [Cryobacterium adonitolivorans]
MFGAPAAQARSVVTAERSIPGGGLLNVAVGLASLGVETDLIAEVGDDAPGDMVRRHLATSAVRFDLVKEVPATSTARGAIRRWRFDSTKPTGESKSANRNPVRRECCRGKRRCSASSNRPVRCSPNWHESYGDKSLNGGETRAAVLPGSRTSPSLWCPPVSHCGSLFGTHRRDDFVAVLRFPKALDQHIQVASVCSRTDRLTSVGEI